MTWALGLYNQLLYYNLNTWRLRWKRPLSPLCLSQALVCVDAVLSRQCEEPQLLLAALDFLSSLGKIVIPPESQVMKSDY